MDGVRVAGAFRMGANAAARLHGDEARRGFSIPLCVYQRNFAYIASNGRVPLAHKQSKLLSIGGNSLSLNKISGKIYSGERLRLPGIRRNAPQSQLTVLRVIHPFAVERAAKQAAHIVI